MATTLTSKGQVTIPKPVRDHLGLVAGSQVTFELAPDGRVTVSRPTIKKVPSRFAKLRGRAGKGMSTDEIMVLTRG